MSDKPEPKVRSMPLVRSEDLNQAMREIVRRAAEVGREAERAALATGEAVRRLPTKPDLADDLVAELQQLLEDEILVAKPAEGEAVIDVREEHREIAKRALIHIKLPQLRVIAEGLGVERGGTLEDVSDRIVRAYHADEEQIARLVLAYETEPPPERRFTTRVFQTLDDPPADLTELAARAELFSRRYIRTGIAKWFVVDNVDRVGGKLTMRGTYRAYSADAEQDDDEYRLRAERGTADARLALRASEPFVEVDAKGVGEAHAMVAAFQHTTKLRARDVLKLNIGSVEGELGRWDEVSVFMTELLNSWFRATPLEIVDLAMVGFQTGDEDASSRRPAVKSVRFQGRHLLDSQTACELLTQGQRLVEWSAMVRFKMTRDDDILVPVTVRLERDHIAAMTGFGANLPAVARRAHEHVLQGIRGTIRDGIRDQSQLQQVAAQIQERASQAGPVDRATIFGPEDDDTAERGDDA